MIINDSKQITSIQKEFNEKFPHLKIEFYKKHHNVGEGSPDTEKVDEEKTLGEVRMTHNSGDLHIDGDMTVSKMEQEFHTNYGLNAQVFRRSGTLWLQTTSTDDWTLHMQNNHAAEELSRSV